MTRNEAEALSTEVEALQQAEGFIELINEQPEANTEVEKLREVLDGALDSKIPGDLFDAIDAIALEALDKIRAAATEAAVQAANDAGITDYTLPEPKAGGETAELEKPEPEAPASEQVAA